MLEAFKEPENVEKINAAKSNLDNSMVNYMHFVFPCMIQIQNKVIAKYGYNSDGEGLIEFALSIRKLEANDPELNELNYQVRTTVMPPLDLYPRQNWRSPKDIVELS